MRVGLVQPAMGREGEAFVASWKMEPLAMAVLAGATPPEHELLFWDDRVEPIDYGAAVDLVGISCETYNARRAYQVAARFRARGVPVVLGGYHPTFLPEEAAHFADAVVIGEAEDVWPRVLEDAARGRLQKMYRGAGRPDLAGRKVDRRVFAGRRYMPVTLVESSRGCLHPCDFCSITAFNARTFAARPAREVAEEMERTGRKWLFLVDDNLSASRNRARELCREIAPLRIHWIGQLTVATGRDPELLEDLRRSGCAGVLVGFESIDEGALRSMNKDFNQGLEGFREPIRRIHDAGIKIYATFVFGYDGAPADIFERTLDFALEQRFTLAAFNHLQPFPGTPLYRRLEAERRLLYPRWWLEPGYRFGTLAFRPQGMAPDELCERLMGLRRRFYSLRHIASRAMNLKANLLGPGMGWLHPSVNLLLRKELGQKWGTPLGDLTEDMPDFAALLGASEAA